MLITHRAVSPADRVSALARLEPLAETEICQFDVEILIQKNVFALQVSIDDPGVVKIICWSEKKLASSSNRSR